MRQALEAMRFASDDISLHKRFMREIFIFASELDFAQSPPAFAQKIHRRLREITGVKDPYFNVKRSFNKLALDMFHDIEMQVNNSEYPFEAAVKFAIAGNIIDSGAKAALSENEVKKTLNKAVSVPLHGNVNAFKKAVNNAGSVLYLTDNAGEIVFDRLLINFLPLKRTVIAVRGVPVINDATMQDAEAAGLHKMAHVINNGSDAPGTILEDCSDEFLEHFENADIVIAKGQGNYETLSGKKDKNIFFLLKVKCPVIAANTGFPIGTHLLLKTPDTIKSTKEKDSYNFEIINA